MEWGGNYECIEAGCESEALEILRSRPIDLLTEDIERPKPYRPEVDQQIPAKELAFNAHDRW